MEDWKIKISNQIEEAQKQRKIASSLKSLASLLLKGDSEFYLVYSSSKDCYFNIRFKNTISKTTSRLLLLNGYKNFYLINK